MRRQKILEVVGKRLVQIVNRLRHCVNVDKSRQWRFIAEIAVFDCGGFTKYAKASAVLILRTKSGQEANIKINIEDLMDDGDLTQNIELLRGDYVIVKEGIF